MPQRPGPLLMIRHRLCLLVATLVVFLIPLLHGISQSHVELPRRLFLIAAAPLIVTLVERRAQFSDNFAINLNAAFGVLAP